MDCLDPTLNGPLGWASLNVSGCKERGCPGCETGPGIDEDPLEDSGR